jgi:hypothetical protein
MKSNLPIWQYVRLHFVFVDEILPAGEENTPVAEYDDCSSAPLLNTALGVEPWPITTITSLLNFE